ncbi:carbohydrate kinase family protein [Candidatus Saccharibacteria bacterium]|nr:carbohydrate kinase family protein [Candidatus Saccharibacteria bacterium]
MSYDLIVLGSSAMDVFAVSRRLKPEKHDRHELIVLPSEQILWLDNAIHDVGGGGLIAAVLCARQGLKPALVSKLGADIFARTIEQILSEEKVGLDHIVTDRKHHTDNTIRLTVNGKHQTLLKYQGSYISLTPREIKMPKVKKGWLYIATLPAEYKTLRTAVNWAKQHKLNVAIHPNNVHTLKSNRLWSLLAECDLVILNRDELSMLLGGYYSATEGLVAAHQHGLKKLALYDGLEGSYYMNENNIFHAPAYKKTKPLEITGAEDSFAAGLLAATIAGETVAKCLALAGAQAAASLSVVGGRSGILRKPLVKEQKLKHFVISDQTRHN